MATKRGPEDDSTLPGPDTDLKKARMEPSRVLHVRGLQPDIQESELFALVAPFGHPNRVLIMHDVRQAFVEMPSIAEAAAVIASIPTALIRGTQVFIQYSQHQELRQKNSIDAAPPTPVVLCKILNMVHPITIDILHQLFSVHGPVLKIVTFARVGAFQGLIQMGSVEAARAAMMFLDGKDIYAGCCTIKVEPSNLSEVRVKYNNDKCRDYTNPDLGPGPAIGGAAAPLVPQAPGYPPAAQQPAAFPGYGAAPIAAQHMQPAASVPGGVIVVNNLNEAAVTCDRLFNLFGVYGDVIRVKITQKNKSTALVQFRNPAQAQTAMQYLNGLPFQGRNMSITISKFPEISLPRADAAERDMTHDYTDSRFHRFKTKKTYTVYPPSATLHLSNLPPNTTEDQLRLLFGAHGTVVNFRFFPNDNKMALMQMSSLEEAIAALVALHLHPLTDTNTLRVSFALKPTIS